MLTFKEKAGLLKRLEAN